ncbi:MAG TPA: hypothetical protein VLM79_01600 [Kofleriaceae bacterium]|nr:hypothetical protein [Kofleriaceae bacterium]
MTRRALLKWSLAAGAALGVSRSRICEILERTAGKGVAFAAGVRRTNRLVALACGNGGLSHFQLFWPQVDVALARDPRFAWHRPREEQLIGGTDRPLAIGPDTPWASLPPERQVTCFVCGVTETHVRNVQSTSILNGSNVFAIASKLQSSTALVPVVTIGDTSIGSATGAPIASNVDSADGLVALFDSAASQASGALAASGDAALFKAQYDTFVQLTRASTRVTQKPAYAVASAAARVVGTNLVSQLAITPEDLARYGIDGSTRPQVAAVGRAFIVAVRAFAAGLTDALLLPAMTDDPHKHFDNNDVAVVPPQLKAVFDAFMADLMATNDDVTGDPLADHTVIALNGDTPKHCLVRDDWPDNTPSNSNLMFIYSAGQLRSGWFGSIDRHGNVQGAGPDGEPTVYDGALTAKLATASLAYAVAKGDETRISDFANGVVVGDAFGARKDK